MPSNKEEEKSNNSSFSSSSVSSDDQKESHPQKKTTSKVSQEQETFNKLMNPMKELENLLKSAKTLKRGTSKEQNGKPQVKK